MTTKKSGRLIQALQQRTNEPLGVVVELEPLNREVLRERSKSERITLLKQHFGAASVGVRKILNDYSMQGISSVWLNCTTYFECTEYCSQETLRTCLDRLENLQEVVFLDVPSLLLAE